MPGYEANLVRLLMMASAAVALFSYRRQIQDALNRFNGRGPRPPSSPLPANDSALLRRKRIRPGR